MSLLEAAILGLVQGLAEFLPISSSGHLKVAEHFLGIQLGDDAIAFEVLLHVATLLAVLVYFRADLKRIFGPWLRSIPALLRGGWPALAEAPQARIGWLVVLSCVPTAIIGLLLKDPLEELSGSIQIVAVMLLVTGCLNWYADWRTSRERQGGRALHDLTPRQALLCGVAQGAALIHGISRSGTTMAAGFACGLQREEAPRFAFLMAIPAILGAAVLSLPDLADATTVAFAPAALGFGISLISGYAALVMVFAAVRRGKLRWFAFYCWAIGALVLALTTLGG